MSIPTTAKTFVLKQSAIVNVNTKLGEKTSNFELIDRPIRELAAGEVLIKTLYLSNDPTQRAWIQKGIIPERMYVPPVLPGQIMRALGIGRIVKSNNSKYKVGELISCNLKWQDYCVIKPQDINNKIPETKLP